MLPGGAKGFLVGLVVFQHELIFRAKERQQDETNNHNDEGHNCIPSQWKKALEPFLHVSSPYLKISKMLMLLSCRPIVANTTKATNMITRMITHQWFLTTWDNHLKIAI